MFNRTAVQKTSPVFIFVGMLLLSSVSLWARPNFNMTLLSSRSISEVRGCWGYVDPGTQREYALICAGNRLEIWNVTAPAAPVLTKTVSATGGELKQIRPYSHYVFAVNQSGVALQVIDMAQIATNPANVTTVKNFNVPGASGAHAVHIDGNYAYLGMNGSADPWWIVNIVDPLNPVAVGSYLTSVASGFRQSHDSYVKGDTGYVAFLGSGFSIVDVSNKSAPAKIADVTYPSPILTHNCWTTVDGKYLFTTDEVSNGYIRVWDVRDPRNPRQVGSWSAGVAGSDVHNVQVIGNFLYASYYSEGVEVLDIEDPTQPIEVGHYDTDPAGNGCWDFFPYFPSGTLVASNYYGATNPGMFLLQFNGAKAGKIVGQVTEMGSGTPLPDAQVRLIDVNKSVLTDAIGHFSLRTAAGSRQVEVSRFGFVTDTFVVNAVFSDSVTLNAALTPLPRGTVSGTVGALGLAAALRQSSRSGPDGPSGPMAGSLTFSGSVSGIRVGIADDELFADTTDASGNYSVDVPAGIPLTILAGRWGLVTKTDTLTLSPSQTVNRNYQFFPGYYDLFEFDQGWSVGDPGDDATAGIWERVAPTAAFNTVGFQTQPGADHSNPGQLCFITGQAHPNQTFQEHDVDGGKTTLYSPLMDLSAYVNPVLSYYRWFSNGGGPNPSEDTIKTEISNDGGSTWVVLEKTRFAQASWVLKQFNLASLIPLTNNMRFGAVISDRQGDSNVEGGLDDFAVSGAPGVRGDFNADGNVNAADVVIYINAVFLGNPALTPAQGDFNGDCLLTAADVIVFLNYAFLGAPLGPVCPSL